MYSKNKLHVYIKFVYLSKVFECDFSIQLSLRENLIKLVNMNNIKKYTIQIMNKDTLVFEASTNQLCDMDIPIYCLNIWNDVELIVY